MLELSAKSTIIGFFAALLALMKWVTSDVASWQLFDQENGDLARESYVTLWLCRDLIEPFNTTS